MAVGSVRDTNRLEERGILRVKDLAGVTEDTLMAIPGFGDVSLVSLKRALKEYVGAP